VNTKIYLGHLPYATTAEDLKSMCGKHGSVTSAKIVSDRETGRSRGFGFVEMSTAEEAQAAITGLNGTPMDGNTLLVKEARVREARPDGSDSSMGSRRPI
jgi:RNA recognition motif-containing protein